MTLIDILFLNIVVLKDVNQNKKTLSKLDNIKNAVPELLKQFVFGKWNPLYVYFVFLSGLRRKGQSIYIKHNIFSKDFIKYISENRNVIFNYEDYYINEDLFALKRFVRYRILSGINANGYIEKKEVFYKKEELYKQISFDRLKKKVKKKNGFYELLFENVKYRLPINRIDPYIYSERYGISVLPKQKIDELEGKVFIDIGAFIGDTAIMLKDYKPSKIVCYEPDSKNLINLRKTIALNDINNIVEIRTTALSDKSGHMSFVQDNASSKLVDDNTIGSDTIQVSTLDIDFEGASNIGLVKMDVEGFERFVIKGGEKMIKLNKPVILISLYHTGADFFEIPPLLRGFLSDVKFRFIDINPFCPNLGEKILIAYF